MKIKLLGIIFILAAFVSTENAQSVVVTGKKVTYKRLKPISEYKKSFTINYPKIKASTPALSKKIEGTLSYARVLKLNLNDELKNTQWIEEADYEVVYNKNGLLCINLSIQGSGAYPDSSSKTVVVDLKTGSHVMPADVFTNLPGLLALVKKAKAKEVVKATKDLKDDPANSEDDPVNLFKESDQYHKVSLSEFSVSDKGVTFIHDYGFPHVVQALQPDGEFFFSWAQLKPYIKSGGLLARWAR